MTDNLKSFASKSLQRNLIMQESFLAGRPFLFKNYQVNFFGLQSASRATNKFLETLHWKRSAEPPVVVKGYLKLKKKEILSRTEVVNMNSQVISWLVQNLGSIVMLLTRYGYGSIFLKLLTQSKQPAIQARKADPLQQIFIYWKGYQI